MSSNNDVKKQLELQILEIQRREQVLLKQEQDRKRLAKDDSGAAKDAKLPISESKKLKSSAAQKSKDNKNVIPIRTFKDAAAEEALAKKAKEATAEKQRQAAAMSKGGASEKSDTGVGANTGGAGVSAGMATALASKNQKKVPKPKDPEQKYAIVNIANHHHTHPSAVGPHLRIIGAYPSHASTRKPIKNLSNSLPNLNTYVVKTNDFALISDSEKNQTDEAYVTSHIQGLIAKLQENKRASEREFAENRKVDRKVQEHLEPPKGFSDEKGSDDKKDAVPEIPQLEKKAVFDALLKDDKEKTEQLARQAKQAENPEPPKDDKVSKDDKAEKADKDELDYDDFPRHLETRNQKYACIAIIPDLLTTDPKVLQEPAVRIFATFDTEEEAKQFNIQVLGKRQNLDLVDLDVVEMYRWLPLDAARLKAANINTQYRNEELDLIMKAKREEQDELESKRVELAKFHDSKK